MKSLRNYALLLVACGLMTLSACGGDGDQTENSGTNNGVADMAVDSGNAGDASGSNNLSPNLDANIDANLDAGSDAGADDMGSGFGRTLADYRRCQSDADCPVGLGTCVVEVPLNRPNSDGTDRVAMSDIFSQLSEGEGVCSAVCTVNGAACDPLQVNGDVADQEPYVCQVVTIGQSPYPDARPAFPFDDLLSRQDLNDGVPFGAICRPPFQLDDGVDRGFCAPCNGGLLACDGTAVCWDFLTDQPAQDGAAGECLGRCDGDCPLGFTCTTLGDADHCVPDSGTCTECLDRDRDGRGTGRCGDAADPVTAVDCDDYNEYAYFDPADEDHPFPTFCDPDNDFNCNGLSDAPEQIGTPEFGAEHCAACGDTCAGPLLNGEFACVQSACVASCDGGWATCDDNEPNGCETSVTDPDLIFFADLDGDGRGDPNSTQFACDASTPPAGHVANDSDCDDSNPATYGPGPAGGAATEICDGQDNDCDNDVDDGVVPPGATCVAAAQGACAAGTYVCTTMWDCQAAAPSAETCNGIDDNCDGSVDLTGGIAPSAAPSWYPDCDGDGQGDDAASGIRLCSAPSAAPALCPMSGWVANNTDCNDAVYTIRSGIGENCRTAADDNCNGVSNSDDPISLWRNTRDYYEDIDLDTYSPNPFGLLAGCGGPPMSGWTWALTSERDCDDMNSSVNPRATETCSTPYDDDCDGDVHNAAAGLVTYFRDNDGDGTGPNSAGQDFCLASMSPFEQNTYTAMNGGDCNDTTTVRTVSSNGHTYSGVDQTPGKQEICEGYDNDCDGVIDDGCPADFLLSSGQPLNQPVGSATSTITSNCAPGEAIYGLRVHSKIQVGFCAGATGVFGLRPLCSKPTIIESANDDPISYTTTTTSVSQTGPLLGQVPVPDPGCLNDTITDRLLRCETLASMRGFYGKAGVVINELGAICVDRDLSYSTTPATLSLLTENLTSVAGWLIGGLPYERRCANNEVVTGITVGFTGGRATSLDPVCSDIDLVLK